MKRGTVFRHEQDRLVNSATCTCQSFFQEDHVWGFKGSHVLLYSRETSFVVAFFRESFFLLLSH